MSYEFTGEVIKVFPKEQKTESFSVRDLIMKSQEDKYPQFIKFQFHNDRCDLLDRLNVGDTATVSFNLRGREWNDNYFTNLNGWKVEVISQAEETPGHATKDEPQAELEGEDEDLPF